MSDTFSRKRTAAIAELEGAELPSSTEALRADELSLPLTAKSDFVLHYRGLSIRSHKLLLTMVSSYFRTYMASLVDGQRSYPAEECNEHPDVDHCIRLPDSCGKVDASVDDFRRFMLQLYFPQHYLCTPYLVAADVDLAATPAPIASPLYRHHFDAWAELELTTTTHDLCTAPCSLYEPVLSLSTTST